MMWRLFYDLFAIAATFTILALWAFVLFTGWLAAIVFKVLMGWAARVAERYAERNA